MDSGESNPSASSPRTDQAETETSPDRTPSVRDNTADEPTRAAVQRRLETIVRENRFTIAVVFPVIGAVTLVASAEELLPPLLSYNPLLILFGTLVMRSPLVVALLPELDRRALGLLAVLTTYTYAIELVGVQTGWPYGTFEYGIRLGPMVGGEIPLALPLFFVPLVLNGYLLTLLALGNRAARVAPRILAAIAAVLAIDLVLDPADFPGRASPLVFPPLQPEVMAIAKDQIGITILIQVGDHHRQRGMQIPIGVKLPRLGPGIRLGLLVPALADQ